MLKYCQPAPDAAPPRHSKLDAIITVMRHSKLDAIITNIRHRELDAIIKHADIHLARALSGSRSGICLCSNHHMMGDTSF